MGAADSVSTTSFAALPGVAREAIRARLEGRDPDPGVVPAGELARPAPVFVTLRLDGELRGCIGSLEPRCRDVVAETADRAIAAAFDDPRFPAVNAEEFAFCTIEVSVLGRLEPVESPEQLDPRVWGVDVASADGRRGVLLPDLDGVDTVEQQLDIVRRKAWIAADAPISIRRFRVTKIEE